jgi:hypothetical protein
VGDGVDTVDTVDARDLVEDAVEEEVAVRAALVCLSSTLSLSLRLFWVIFVEIVDGFECQTLKGIPTSTSPDEALLSSWTILPVAGSSWCTLCMSCWYPSYVGACLGGPICPGVFKIKPEELIRHKWHDDHHPGVTE